MLHPEKDSFDIFSKIRKILTHVNISFFFFFFPLGNEYLEICTNKQ